jgi:N-acetylglutamate synthase-like GNAT family acetyltransferase
LIIAILKKRGQLYIDLSSYNKGSKELEFKISAYYKEDHKKKEEVGDLEYTLKVNKNGIPKEIHVDNIDVREPLWKKGYGRILMSFCQAIAQASNLKVTLFSLGDVVGFYRRCGFNPACKDSQDMIWRVKKRKKHDAKRVKI